MVDKLIKRKEAAEMLGISWTPWIMQEWKGWTLTFSMLRRAVYILLKLDFRSILQGSTHRARPKDNNPTFRKKRTVRSEIRHR